MAHLQLVFRLDYMHLLLTFGSDDQVKFEIEKELRFSYGVEGTHIDIDDVGYIICCPESTYYGSSVGPVIETIRPIPLPSEVVQNFVDVLARVFKNKRHFTFEELLDHKEKLAEISLVF